MYGKVFDSIYDGTLYGHWEAIVTMQQLIVLASPDGVIDMTPQAIAARTSIPLDIIVKGIKVLSEPDPYTRTPGEDGRRITLMDDHRPWGWRLVNHGKYQRLRDMKQKREADRVRIAEKRNQNKDVAIKSQDVANVAPTYSYSDSNSDSKNTTAANAASSQAFEDFWKSYPKRAGANPKSRALKAYCARIREGSTPQEILDGLNRYTAFCRGAGKLGTEFVLQAATFVGPDRLYAETWDGAQGSAPDYSAVVKQLEEREKANAGS